MQRFLYVLNSILLFGFCVVLTLINCESRTSDPTTEVRCDQFSGGINVTVSSEYLESGYQVTFEWNQSDEFKSYHLVLTQDSSIQEDYVDITSPFIIDHFAQGEAQWVFTANRHQCDPLKTTGTLSLSRCDTWTATPTIPRFHPTDGVAGQIFSCAVSPKWGATSYKAEYAVSPFDTWTSVTVDDSDPLLVVASSTINETGEYKFRIQAERDGCENPTDWFTSNRFVVKLSDSVVLETDLMVKDDWTEEELTDIYANHWFHITLLANTSYVITWADSFDGTGEETADVNATVYLNDKISLPVFKNRDSGYTQPIIYTPSTDEELYLYIEQDISKEGSFKIKVYEGSFDPCAEWSTDPLSIKSQPQAAEMGTSFSLNIDGIDGATEYIFDWDIDPTDTVVWNGDDESKPKAIFGSNETTYSRTIGFPGLYQFRVHAQKNNNISLDPNQKTFCEPTEWQMSDAFEVLCKEEWETIVPVFYSPPVALEFREPLLIYPNDTTLSVEVQKIEIAQQYAIQWAELDPENTLDPPVWSETSFSQEPFFTIDLHTDQAYASIMFRVSGVTKEGCYTQWLESPDYNVSHCEQLIFWSNDQGDIQYYFPLMIKFQAGTECVFGPTASKIPKDKPIKAGGFNEPFINSDLIINFPSDSSELCLLGTIHLQDPNHIHFNDTAMNPITVDLSTGDFSIMEPPVVLLDRAELRVCVQSEIPLDSNWIIYFAGYTN